MKLEGKGGDRGRGLRARVAVLGEGVWDTIYIAIKFCFFFFFFMDIRIRFAFAFFFFFFKLTSEFIESRKPMSS